MATNDDRAGEDPDGSEAGTDSERIGAEPIDGDGTYPFAGITRWDESVDASYLPENVWGQQSSMQYWAQNRRGTSEVDPSELPERGLHTLTHELPRASLADVKWVHPRTGEEIGTAKHNAVIDPDKAEDIHLGLGSVAEAIEFVTEMRVSEADAQAEIDEHNVEQAKRRLLDDEEREQLASLTIGEDALYNVPTKSYSIINPAQFLEPLCEVLQERDLGDKVFGEVRLDRGGGRATLDIYVDGQHVEAPCFGPDREPVVVGLEVQYDFYNDWAVRASGQGLDWGCVNRIHRMTDREIVKHSGDVEGRVDWHEMWESLLDRLDEKRDQLSQIIQQASEMTLDLSDLPNDIGEKFEDRDAAPWTALYAYMGLPDYLAEHAGRRLQSRATDAYEPTWWEIHSAATYAVSHHDRGDRTTGGSYADHARVANDALINPAGMEETIADNYEAARRDDDQSALAEEAGGRAQIEGAFESVRDRKEQYEEWEEELRSLGVEV